jgi:hypothetical protein
MPSFSVAYASKRGRSSSQFHRRALYTCFHRVVNTDSQMFFSLRCFLGRSSFMDKQTEHLTSGTGAFRLPREFQATVPSLHFEVRGLPRQV